MLLKGGGKTHTDISGKGIIIVIIVFAASGGVMICQKLMGIYFADESVSTYNFYSFIIPAILLGSVTFHKRSADKGSLKVLPFAAGSAISLCVISFVMTSLAGRVPSVIMFPLFNGIGIVLVCIGSVFVFKEKMNKTKLLGISLGLIGLFLINAF